MYRLAFLIPPSTARDPWRAAFVPRVLPQYFAMGNMIGLRLHWPRIQGLISEILHVDNYIFWVRETPKLSNTQGALCSVWFNIIFHIITSNARFRENFINRHTRVLFFSKNLFDNFFILRNFLRDLIKKCISVCKYSTHYSCHNLMNIEFYGRIFKVFSIIKFHEIPSSAIRVISKGDRKTRQWWGPRLYFWHPFNRNRQTQTQTHNYRHYKQVPLSYLLNRSCLNLR